MSKRKLKAALALVLALSMIPASVPVKALEIKTALKNPTHIVSKIKKNETGNKGNYAEGEAVILYKNSSSDARKIKSSSTLGDDLEISRTYDFGETKSVSGSTKSKTTLSDTGFSISLVKSDKYTTEQLIKILKKRSDIKYAVPNYRIKSLASEEPYEKYQWALKNTGQNGGTEGLDINADTESLQNSINDDEKVIAVVDSGMDYTHEDLQDVIWNNPLSSKQLKGEHGYDFANYDADPMDDNGHGTHCSGIIAASANNEKGIAGTAQNNVKIMGLKILDEEGMAYGMEVFGAYNYIYRAQKLGINIVAVNNSWGAILEDESLVEEISPIMLEIINMVGEKGAVSVCAAGNESNDNEMVYILPANLESPYIISVAASDENDELASFSNYGNNVDIAAPGTNILSTVSYNTFNPILYDNKDEMCSLYEDFESGELLKTMQDGKENGITAQEGEIAYGLNADAKGDMAVSIEDGTYFGLQSKGTKSVKWTIEGAKQGGIYTLYLPYVADASSTPLYSSVMAKVTGPSGTSEDLFGFDESALIVSDGKITDGEYDEEGETFINGTYISETNCWDFFSSEVKASVDEAEQRAMAFYVIAGEDGDYTVSIDKMGVSKAEAEPDTFGKYNFYSGTSMAAPFVTGAIGAIANSFDDKTALERKARVLGSVRKRDVLMGLVSTGGVMDLSKIANPGMSISGAALKDNKQIEISGYYLSGAALQINGETVTPIEHTENKICVNAADYFNKQLDIEIIKGDDYVTGQYFFMSGKKFDDAETADGFLNGGDVVSNGESLYYIDDMGDVCIGTPVKVDGKETLEWEDSMSMYDPEIFGDCYKTVVDYYMGNATDFVSLNKVIYTVLSIDVGYAKDSLLAYFDEEKGWQKYADIPEEFAGASGVSLTAYNGKLYLMGGFDEENENCSDKVQYYDSTKKIWTAAPSLPEARCFSKAMQVGNRLIVTLGGDGENETVSNLIFDGKNWTVSKASLGSIIDYDSYLYESENGYGEIPISTAQTGVIKDGIVYTDLKVEGLGDTFTYNVNTDKYAESGYYLDSNSLDGDQLFATTVQNKLYVLYGNSYSDAEFEYGYEYGKADSELDYDDLEDLDSDELLGDIHVCTMPVNSGFVQVTDGSDANAYVEGAGYYLPSDMIKLMPKVYEEGYIISFSVNGQNIKADGKGIYSYTVSAGAVTTPLKAVAKSGSYVTEIYLDNDIITLENSSDTSRSTYQMHADIYPEDAGNKNIKWTTSNPAVATVDATGKITVAKTAKPNQVVTIRAIAMDRGTISAECLVIIGKTNVIKKNSKIKTGNFTYKVDNFSAKKKTVTCLSFNKKKASKASVPAIVKINGYKFKVTKIAENAFKNCKKLRSVTIGKYVTSIGKNAWSGCKKLKKVTIKTAKIKYFGKKMFKGTNKKLTVQVPKSAKKSYSKKLKKSGFRGKIK